MGYCANGYHQRRMIALAMIVISLCSCTLVGPDSEGDGWNIWEAVALWLKMFKRWRLEGLGLCRVKVVDLVVVLRVVIRLGINLIGIGVC